jgi:hypothetical protein
MAGWLILLVGDTTSPADFPCVVHRFPSQVEVDPLDPDVQSRRGRSWDEAYTAEQVGDGSTVQLGSHMAETPERWLGEREEPVGVARMGPCAREGESIGQPWLAILVGQIHRCTSLSSTIS